MCHAPLHGLTLPTTFPFIHLVWVPHGLHTRFGFPCTLAAGQHNCTFSPGSGFVLQGSTPTPPRPAPPRPTHPPTHPPPAPPAGGGRGGGGEGERGGERGRGRGGGERESLKDSCVHVSCVCACVCVCAHVHGPITEMGNGKCGHAMKVSGRAFACLCVSTALYGASKRAFSCFWVCLPSPTAKRPRLALGGAPRSHGSEGGSAEFEPAEHG